MNRYLLPMLAALVVACTEGRNPSPDSAQSGPVQPPRQGEVAPVRPPPRIWLQPSDLVTNIGATDLRVFVDNYGGPIPADLLQEIAANVEVQEVGIGAVAATVQIHNSDSATARDTSGSGQIVGAQYGWVQVAPASKLGQGWHVLVLKKVPANVEVSGGYVKSQAAGAGIQARFTVDSRPVLADFEACSKGSTTYRAAVRFSETVFVDDSAVAKALAVTQDGGQCAFVSMMQGAGLARTLEFDCTGSQRTWSFTLAPGLQSATDVAATMADGRQTATISLQPMSLDTTGCVRWHAD